MKSNHSLKLVAVACLAAVAAGCTTPLVHGVDSEHRAIGREIQKELDGQVDDGKQVNLLSKTPEIYAVGKSFTVRQDEAPASFDRQVSISREIASMDELISRFSQLSGVTVVFKKDISGGGQGGQSQSGADASKAAAPASPFGAPSMGGQSGGNQQMGMPQTLMLNYRGTFKGLLDFMTTKYGFYWKYKDGRVYLYETDTRVFEVATLPGDIQTSAQIGAQGDSSAGTSGSQSASNSSSSISSSNDIRIWSSLEQNIRLILSSKGRISVSPSTGNITVTDTPEVLDAVEKYIEGENRSLSRQVAMKVTVLHVETKASDNYGINWSNVSRLLGSGKYGLSFASNTLLNGSSPNLTVDILKGKYAGAQAMISAISEKNKINSVTNFSAITLNNQPVPVNVGDQRAYLASIEVTTTTDGTTTSLTPGVASYGTTMNVLPRIMKDGTIMMQMSLDISDLVAIETFGPASTQIQLPELAHKTFLQRASLKSGEMLILAGFESSKGTSSRAGVGAAENSLLGGKLAGEDSRQSTVVLIQPIILDAER